MFNYYIVLYSYSTSTQMVWFKAEEPEDCKTAPEEVNSEELPKDICDEVSLILKIKIVS